VSSKNNNKPIDGIDCGIIRLLQQNGRISNRAISKKLGITETTTRTRLNRLIKNGIIQVVAVSNPFKLGFGVIGNSKIRIDVGKVDIVINELKKIREIWYIALATGGTDIDAEFNVKSLDDLNTLLFEKISKIPGINQIDTSLILRFAKRDYAWGTAVDQG
jgi:Lrp/AsnC family transcriptional regulator, regulator for asnA, asnC and gidA